MFPTITDSIFSEPHFISLWQTLFVMLLVVFSHLILLLFPQLTKEWNSRDNFFLFLPDPELDVIDSMDISPPSISSVTSSVVPTSFSLTSSPLTLRDPTTGAHFIQSQLLQVCHKIWRTLSLFLSLRHSIDLPVSPDLCIFVPMPPDLCMNVPVSLDLCIDVLVYQDLCINVPCVPRLVYWCACVPQLLYQCACVPWPVYRCACVP